MSHASHPRCCSARSGRLAAPLWPWAAISSCWPLRSWLLRSSFRTTTRMAVPADRARLLVFGALIITATLAVVVYARYLRVRPEIPSGRALAIVNDPIQLRAIRQHAHLLFRNTTLGSAYGRLAAVSLSAPNGTRYVTSLSCDRVHAAGTLGLCLSASRGVFTSYRADAFDRDFRVIQTFPLEGVPSRTRVSRDGAMAGATVFVAGDSYAVDTFSTRTVLYDLRV